jgi:hypothetical protein
MNGLLRSSWSRIARAFLLAALAFALLGAAPTTPHRTGDPSLSQEELDALLAPIALYPDDLLGQVLMASTYPLEVVEAERFLKQNPGLRGEALDEALAKKNWDPSVQSLAAYPKVLIMMSERLEWTERLGNAFLQDQGRVMDTVQALRRRAEAAGNLKSKAEQSVVHDKETIIIEPAQTEVVYVPVYDSVVVYGAWYSEYYYYHRYYGYMSVSDSYSESYRISRDHRDWARADWHDRRYTVRGAENRFWNSGGRAQAAAGSAWQHDPSHRGAVGYPTSAMRDQFRQVDASAGRPGDGNRGSVPAASGSGAPTGPAGEASPSRPPQPPGGSRSGPMELPDPARGLLQALADKPGPSMSGGGTPSFRPGGPPSFGAGGPPIGPPPGPPPLPGPH